MTYLLQNQLYILWWRPDVTCKRVLKSEYLSHLKNTKLAVNYYNNKNYSNITGYDVLTPVWAMLIDGKEDLFFPECNLISWII